MGTAIFCSSLQTSHNLCSPNDTSQKGFIRIFNSRSMISLDITWTFSGPPPSKEQKWDPNHPHPTMNYVENKIKFQNKRLLKLLETSKLLTNTLKNTNLSNQKGNITANLILLSKESPSPAQLITYYTQHQPHPKVPHGFMSRD